MDKATSGQDTDGRWESAAAARRLGGMTSEITCEIADQVAFVRLNRPDKFNALSMPMLQELVATAHRLRRDASVRAVVISGEGPAFCAGIDTSVLSSGLPGVLGAFLPRPWRGTNTFQEACWAWRRIPAPVVAVVHGHCYGAGLQLALGADFRISTPEAKWSVMEAKWGLIPDMSGVHALTQVVGLDTAKELTMTARTVTGAQARELGLVTRVAADPHLAAGELIDEILTRSPDSVAATKRIFERSWPGRARSTFGRERVEQLGLLLAKNTKIVRAAARSETPPVYAPRAR